MRPTLPLALLILAACASAPVPAPGEDLIEDTERPFIKLARRELALVTYWRGSPPPPGYQEELERRLVRHFRTTYRTTIYPFRREGTFGALDPRLTLSLVERGVDDVVVVEAEQLGERDGPMRGRVLVLVMDTQEILHEMALPEVGSAGAGRPTAPRFADLVWDGLTRAWTDPGAATELDAMRAADHLADRGACDHAVLVYDFVFPRSQPRAVNDIARHERSRKRYELCRRRIAMRDAVLKDQAAVFGLELDVTGLPAAYRDAMTAAMEGSKLERVLRGMTNKPVRVEVQPGNIVMSLRYNKEWYVRVTGAAEPSADAPAAAPLLAELELEPFVPAMEALLDLRDRAVELLPSAERSALAGFHTTLKLTKLVANHVELDFADLDGRVLLTDAMRVKMGRRQEITVTARAPGVSRSRRFVLGPPHDANGRPTLDALLHQFFEVEPPGR